MSNVTGSTEYSAAAKWNVAKFNGIPWNLEVAISNDFYQGSMEYSMESAAVTGLLSGEFTGDRWIPPQQPVTRSFDVFFDQRLNRRLNNREACDLRRHRAYYDTVMHGYACTTRWIEWSYFSSQKEMHICIVVTKYQFVVELVARFPSL